MSGFAATSSSHFSNSYNGSSSKDDEKDLEELKILITAIKPPLGNLLYALRKGSEIYTDVNTIYNTSSITKINKIFQKMHKAIERCVSDALTTYTMGRSDSAYTLDQLASNKYGFPANFENDAMQTDRVFCNGETELKDETTQLTTFKSSNMFFNTKPSLPTFNFSESKKKIKSVLLYIWKNLWDFNDALLITNKFTKDYFINQYLFRRNEKFILALSQATSLALTGNNNYTFQELGINVGSDGLQKACKETQPFFPWGGKHQKTNRRREQTNKRNKKRKPKTNKKKRKN